MKSIMKIIIIIGFTAVICCGVFLLYLNNQVGSSKETTTIESQKMIDRIIPTGSIPSIYLASTRTVIIHAIEPKKPDSVTIYRGIFRDGDKRDIILGDSLKKKTSVISQEEAPEVAKKAMEQYGGLPSDAELAVSRTNYLMKKNGSSGETVESTPLYTAVSYYRKINGMPVGGQSDKLDINLGENGTILRIYKIWRTLEPVTNKATVISPDRAVDKLQSGQLLDPPLGMNEDVNINSITLGYYESSRTEPEILIEPIWIFSGKTTSGSEIKFNVYARQFAAFDQTPAVTRKSVAGKTISEEDPYTAEFTDTSDASPSKWLWDFGDGTTSTEQNPTHTYKAAGTYNVTLTVWNDMGSDTMTQQYIVEGTPRKTAADSTAETTKAVVADDETPVIDTSKSVETAIEATGTVNNSTNSSDITEMVSAIPTILSETPRNITAINST